MYNLIVRFFKAFKDKIPITVKAKSKHNAG